jgi:hypothetical protein
VKVFDSFVLDAAPKGSRRRLGLALRKLLDRPAVSGTGDRHSGRMLFAPL